MRGRIVPSRSRKEAAKEAELARILKWPIGFNEMKAEGHPIFFGVQDGQMYYWTVSDEDPFFTNKLRVVGTGEEFDSKWFHVASLQSGPFVWHLMGNSE